MRILIALVACAVAWQSTQAKAQSNTPEQRRACQGDVMRLCFWFIPDRAKIIRCMTAKHDELSPVCMKVFDAGMKTLAR